MCTDVCISVVVPSYNYADRLPRALHSVLEQREPGVEVIVVDDGSTDHTGNVLDDLHRTWPELIVIRQPNAGAAAARNHGVRRSSGRYLLMLDADDELIPGSLALLKSTVGHHPEAGLILGGHISVDERGHERERSASVVGDGSASELIDRYLLKKRIAISHGCSLFRRDVIEGCPYPEYLRSGEDIAVFAYALIAAPVVRLPQAIARIHKHADSLRHQRNNENPLVIVESVFARLPESFEKLKVPYHAQRLLSLFRAALLAGDTTQARAFYLQALRASPRQALRLTYLRKALRLLR
ncbi:glycosyltransferase family 2 protein [Halopseudomonas bauzanensis]|uniref:glycosyltransferase family 2 protein n=1 Tax=Halopseudomonas bauzanensis TaxID=653930 RepID=UPI003524BE4D